MWQDHADKITAAQWVTDEDVYTTSYDGYVDFFYVWCCDNVM